MIVIVLALKVIANAHIKVRGLNKPLSLKWQIIHTKKYDIFNNVGNQTVEGAIDFHSLEKNTMGNNSYRQLLVTNIL